MSDNTIVHKNCPYYYTIPMYAVVEGKGIELIRNEKNQMEGVEIPMVRGSRVKEENIVKPQDGVLVEQLLEVCLQHLKEVNTGDLATRETSLAITAIEEAQLRLLQREINRKKNNTLGTYKS